MAYQLHYWEQGNNKDTHYELKCVRLRSLDETFPLSLVHNRPKNTVLITLDRSDKQSNIEKIIWESGMDYPASPKVRNRNK